MLVVQLGWRANGAIVSWLGATVLSGEVELINWSAIGLAQAARSGYTVAQEFGRPTCRTTEDGWQPSQRKVFPSRQGGDYE